MANLVADLITDHSPECSSIGWSEQSVNRRFAKSKSVHTIRGCFLNISFINQWRVSTETDLKRTTTLELVSANDHKNEFIEITD